MLRLLSKYNHLNNQFSKEKKSHDNQEYKKT